MSATDSQVESNPHVLFRAKVEADNMVPVKKKAIYQSSSILLSYTCTYILITPISMKPN